MTIVAVVLLSVAAAVCCYAAWFFVHIAYQTLMEKVLRAVTGRRKPDYARIKELEACELPDGRRFPIDASQVIAAKTVLAVAARSVAGQLWVATHPDAKFGEFPRRLDEGEEWRAVPDGRHIGAKPKDKGMMLWHCPACGNDWISEAAIRAHREREHGVPATRQAAP